MEAFGIWLAALLTIGIISFLYKDNVLYKACEAIFVGISAGYWFITYYWDNLYRKFYLGITDMNNPNRFFLWIAFFLGVLMLTRLFNKIGWLSRWPLAFVVGATAGLYMMIYFVSNAFVQVGATIKPPPGLGSWGSYVDYGLIAFGTVCGLIYFFFSKEHKGIFGGTAKIGIWFLMITFGASFGYTVMSRMSLMLGRLDFLFGAWLGMIRG
jgi:hypothetical protein